jgi:hypothetical protein
LTRENIFIEGGFLSRYCAVTLTITRKGEKLETEYSVVPSPAKPTPQEILDLYQEKKIDLNALFDGKNPFDATERDSSLDRADFPTNTRNARKANTDVGDDVPFP